MAESSWPTIAGGRAVNDVQWELMSAGFSTDGIIGSPADTPVIYADSTGMQVKVRANRYGLVKGHGWTSGTSEYTKAVTANASGQTRIDLVVLRLNRTDQTTTVQVKAGTAGSGVPPTPTQDASSGGTGTYEVPLARVTVASGVSTITAANVTPVTPFIGRDQILYVADTTTMNALPSPYDGQIVYVASMATLGFPLYRYTGSVWRRLDWYSSWGIIAGTRYPGSGDVAYAYTGGGDTGIRTGNAALLNGRRYQIELSFPFGWSATGDVWASIVFDVVKDAGDVSIGTYTDMPPNPVNTTWTQQVIFDYQPTSDETVNFQLNSFAWKVSGSTLNWASFKRGNNSYFRVRDNGPSSTMTNG